MRLLKAVLGVALPICACAWRARAAEEPKVPGLGSDAAPFHWSNPITFQGRTGKDEIRDPCILREGGTYYLVFTMWPFRGREEGFLKEANQGGSPGIAMYASEDLASWRFEKWLVRSSIDLSGIGQDRVRLIGRPKRIVEADNSDIGMAARHDYLEGPWARKIGGKYVLFFAGPYRKEKLPQHDGRPPSAGYWAGVAYADSVMGPWRKDRRGQVFWGGHLAVFDGPAGRLWLAYRGEKIRETRGFLCIDPFDLAPDGTVQCHGPSVGEQSVPLPHR